MAFASIANIHLDWDQLKDWNELTPDQKAAVAEVRITTTETDAGTTTRRIVKMHDKLKALVSIAKHVGLFDNDNQKQIPVINLHLVDSNPRRLNQK